MLNKFTKKIQNDINYPIIPTFIWFIFLVGNIYLFTNIGLHKWHGSHLTPHMLGVALNINDSLLLCNYINPECESYHRHPPLYFFINYIIARVSNNFDMYINVSMSISILINFAGVALLMKLFGKNDTDKIFVLIFLMSTFNYIVSQSLATYDCFILLIMAMFIQSITLQKHRVGYIAVFLSMILSWYLVLAATIYTIKKIHEKNYHVLIPYILGLIFTLLFLLIGSEHLMENINSSLKNIDFSKNISTERVYSLYQTVIMLMSSLYISISPLFYFILTIVLFKTKLNVLKEKSLNVIKKNQGILIFNLLVFSTWNLIFFRWSLIHNFIYIMLIPLFLVFYISILELLDLSQKKIILIFSILVIVYQYSVALDGFNPIDSYNNEGVNIIKEAIINYGYFDN